MGSMTERQAVTIVLLVAVVVIVLLATVFRPTISTITPPACTPLPSGMVCEGV